jgi:hypothetical protein
VADYDTTSGNTDIICFTDITPDEIATLCKVEYDLKIFFADTCIVLKNYFYHHAHQVEKFEFADGFVCSGQELIELVGSIA